MVLLKIPVLGRDHLKDILMKEQHLLIETSNYSLPENKEALAIRRIFSLVDMITKAKFSNSPNDFKIRLFG